jgi:hypothetical protein
LSCDEYMHREKLGSQAAKRRFQLDRSLHITNLL